MMALVSSYVPVIMRFIERTVTWFGPIATKYFTVRHNNISCHLRSGLTTIAMKEYYIVLYCWNMQRVKVVKFCRSPHCASCPSVRLSVHFVPASDSKRRGHRKARISANVPHGERNQCSMSTLNC